MHLRTSRVTRNGKAYEYLQIVQSYRRPDGMPAHRVVANLGNLEELEVANLRVALSAGREGKRVVVARAAAPRTQLAPTANLRYLDLAVLLEIWRSWGLDELLASMLPRTQAEVPLKAVVCALVLQRCVDPGSKLHATRWVPQTALPELLGFAPAQFNNTRVHRALDALEESTDLVMPKLVSAYQEHDGAFAALFVDVTDTWFVGHGPEQAEYGKTKEGMVRRKIGIVLMCNERGYPLRWEVVAGCAADCTTMSAMARSVAGLKWLDKVPVVCDRAMGKTAQLRELLDAKLHFVTALTTTEFDAYAPQIPTAALSDFDPPTDATRDAKARTAAVDEARRRLLAAGMKQEKDDLLLLDLGVVTRAGDEEEPDASSVPTDSEEDLTVVAMRHCREMTAALAAGRCQSLATAGRVRGLSKALASKYWALRALPDAVQCRVVAGAATGRALVDLLAIARLGDREEQLEAFDALLATPREPGRLRGPTSARHRKERDDTPVRVRAAVYFNPELFVDVRLRAAEQLARVRRAIDELNQALDAPRSRSKPPQISAAIDRVLRKEDLLDAFAFQVQTRKEDGRERFHVSLSLQQGAWTRRRRYDGFCVVVAHPEVTLDAAALCRLYRQKDAVEKDFQTIKSVIELRPVHHREDHKVRAHVALCMLALLLERTLHHKLQGLHSAPAALDVLRPLHLNHYAGGEGPGVYLVTRTDAAQDKILARLRLRRLALDEDIAPRITPR